MKRLTTKDFLYFGTEEVLRVYNFRYTRGVSEIVDVKQIREIASKNDFDISNDSDATALANFYRTTFLIYKHGFEYDYERVARPTKPTLIAARYHAYCPILYYYDAVAYADVTLNYTGRMLSPKFPKEMFIVLSPDEISMLTLADTALGEESCKKVEEQVVWEYVSNTLPIKFSK